jgi:AcrR family transcriptional regulator
VAKSSLLWHFGSKEMLLAEAAISLFQEIELALRPDDLEGRPLAERVDEIFDRVADYFTRNPETKGVVMALLFSANTPQSVREHIREGGTAMSACWWRRWARRAPAFYRHHRLLVAIFHGAYRHWYANGRTQPIGDYLHPARTCS